MTARRRAGRPALLVVAEDLQLEGKVVARFKGGDNFVFGRGFEEIIACREAGVPVTVIPGVTSPIAVPGVAGLPVTHRGVAHEFTVISGHLPPDHPESLTDWDAVARLTGTLVLMMAVQNAPVIAQRLMDGGRSAATPVGIVCDGTMPEERTVLSTLGTLASDLEREQVRPPAIMISWRSRTKRKQAMVFKISMGGSGGFFTAAQSPFFSSMRR